MKAPIVCKSYPRAAIIGNPSDGYYGKTIAFIFSNFSATITLKHSSQIEICSPSSDTSKYEDIDAFESNIDQYGYYGVERLIKAAMKVFFSFCKENEIALHNQNFSISYHTDIPRSLGLAGSSALITATMRSLMKYYNVQIDNASLSNLILSAEVDELGIAAGLQDRVAQSYAHPIYMDFDKSYIEKHGHGRYVSIDPGLFPPFYIAYRISNSETSEKAHGNLKSRSNEKDATFYKKINELADLTDNFYQKLKEGDQAQLGHLMNTNFDIRKQLMPISAPNQKLIDIARKCGVSAKFTGSGGAIVGTYQNEEQIEALKQVMNEYGAEVIIPKIVNQ